MISANYTKKCKTQSYKMPSLPLRQSGTILTEYLIVTAVFMLVLYWALFPGRDITVNGQTIHVPGLSEIIADKEQQFIKVLEQP